MDKISHDSETAAHGQQVITACAFIHARQEGITKVFLPKRAETKKFLPGVYELPGGHIEYGEDIVAGLQREIMEEFGATIAVGDPFAAFTYTNEIKGSHSIEIIYFARFESDPAEIMINPADHSTFGWFAEDELTHATSETKGLNNIEFQAIQKGFALLKGNSLNT